MFAPEAMATRFCPLTRLPCSHFFRPAMPRAPEGSSSVRVSSQTSLIAAQISSVDTVTMASTNCRHNLKFSRPTCLTATPSAKITHPPKPDPPTGGQRLAHGVGFDRLHPDNFDLGANLFDVGRDAGDQTAAADRNEDRVQDAAMLFQYFLPNRALAGNDGRVVERVHKYMPTAVAYLDRKFVGLIKAVADQLNPCAPAFNRLELDRRGRHRHHHNRGAAESMRAHRDALGVVAGRRDHHAAFSPRAVLNCAILL